jgi:microcystin-dependent protein
MADNFIGEIRVFPFDFPPQGWAKCDGTLQPIQQNPALYSLIGTIYGGDGSKTFALPDLRGRTPVEAGVNAVTQETVTLGKANGAENVSLTISTIPPHIHPVYGQNSFGNAASPIAQTTCLWAVPSDSTQKQIAGNAFGAAASLAQMDPTTITSTGVNAGHNNMQPYLTLNFCIALTGYYPSRP